MSAAPSFLERPHARRSLPAPSSRQPGFVSPLQRSPAHQIRALLGSRAVVYVLLAASVDLFALTPVFSRRIDTTGLSGGILFAWAFFCAVSVALLLFLWFGMWWHWLVIG